MPKKKLQYEIPESRKLPYSTEIVAKWLLRAPIVGALDIILGFDEKFLVLGLGSRSQINGRIYPMGDRVASSIDCFDVSKRMQRRGLGERLLKAYIAESKANGAQDLWSDQVSSQALGLRAKVLGVENLHFFDSDASETQRDFLPISLEQAMLSNARIDLLDSEPYYRDAQGHIGVYVNLEQIDTSDWEAPQVIQIREPNPVELLVS